MHLKSTPTDGFPTPTSKVQAETENILRTHIPDSRWNVKEGHPNTNETSATERAEINGSEEPQKAHQKPELHRNLHLAFLARNLVQGFPVRYISQDASQPWLLFWTVQAFSVMQVAIDPNNKQRYVSPVVDYHNIKLTHSCLSICQESLRR